MFLDRVDEITGVRIESAQKAKEGGPGPVDPAVLHTRDVRVVGARTLGQLLLREPGPIAQLAEPRPSAARSLLVMLSSIDR